MSCLARTWVGYNPAHGAGRRLHKSENNPTISSKLHKYNLLSREKKKVRMNHLMLSTHQHHINSKEAHRPFLNVLFEESVYPLAHICIQEAFSFCAVCSYHERTVGVITLASQHLSLLALLRSKVRYSTTTTFAWVNFISNVPQRRFHFLIREPWQIEFKRKLSTSLKCTAVFLMKITYGEANAEYWKI